MLILKVALIIVLYSGGDAAVLPDVGSCSFMEYFCSARSCTTAFVKDLQKDPTGDCSVKYNQMVNCVVKTLKVCRGDSLSDSQLQEIVRQNANKDELCLEGGLEVPTMPPLIGSPCSPSFSSNANACVKTFHEKFAANKSDPSLCMENAKAKRCMNDLIANNCTFPPAVQPTLQRMFDLSFSDHNPFCPDNRDPGATGSDECDGVKDPSKQTDNNTKSAGIRNRLSRALLFSVVLLLLFFVKM